MTIKSIGVVARNPATVPGGAIVPTAIAIAAPYSPGPAVSATSSSTRTIQTGPTDFAVNEAHVAFASGMRVRASPIGTPNTWMEGIVNTFDGVTLAFTVDRTKGAGSYSSWTINVAGEPGDPGAQGIQGVVGPTGVQGIQGVQGIPGIPGATGDLPLHNGKIVLSAASNALTIALKTLAGTDPTAGNPVSINFIDTSGSQTTVQVTAALSLVIPAGATMGTVNARAFRLWIAAFLDASSVVRLAASTCWDFINNTGLLSAHMSDGVQTAFLVDAASDVSGQWVSSATMSAKLARVIAHAVWNASGVVTAGNWTVTNLQETLLVTPWTKRPGDTVQVWQNYSQVQSGTSTDLTTPALSGLAITLSPTRSCNVFRLFAKGNMRQASAGMISLAEFYRDGVILLAAPHSRVAGAYVTYDTGAGVGDAVLMGWYHANSVAVQVYDIRVRSTTGGFATWNTIAGGTFFEMQEIVT